MNKRKPLIVFGDPDRRGETRVRPHIIGNMVAGGISGDDSPTKNSAKAASETASLNPFAAEAAAMRAQLNLPGANSDSSVYGVYAAADKYDNGHVVRSDASGGSNDGGGFWDWLEHDTWVGRQIIQPVEGWFSTADTPNSAIVPSNADAGIEKAIGYYRLSEQEKFGSNYINTGYSCLIAGSMSTYHSPAEQRAANWAGVPVAGQWYAGNLAWENGNHFMAVHHWSMSTAEAIALPDLAVSLTKGAATYLPKAASTAVPTGDIYSVAFETKLDPLSYPGVSRGAHFQEANESLLQAMEEDADFAQEMQKLGINPQRTSTGLAPRTSPSDWTWHHAEEPGVLQLVPRTQHQPGSIFQDALHPNNKGGYSEWGK